MIDEWVAQCHGGQLGNFTVITPAIRALSEVMERPVQVWFETVNLRELWRDCPWIKLIDCPRTDKWALFTTTGEPPKSGLVIDDIMTYPRRLGYKGPTPRPYTDSPGCPIELPSGKRVAIIQGMQLQWSDEIKAKKDNGFDWRLSVLHAVADAKAAPVIICYEAEYARFWQPIEADFPQGTTVCARTPIRDAVGVGIRCDALVCNDTGMFHVLCGAHGVPAFNVHKWIEPQWLYPYPGACYNKTQHPMSTIQKLRQWLGGVL